MHCEHRTVNPTDVARQVEQFGLARASLFADLSRQADAFTDAYSDLVDGFVTELFSATQLGVRAASSGVAVVALGGYGRRQMCPHSDIDLALIHRSVRGIEALADALWYPLWDTKIKLGHAVRALTDLPDVCADVESVTALLDGRWICGDPSVVEEMTEQVLATAAEQRDAIVAWLHADSTARRQRFGSLAYRVEPNVKQAHGGLRDAQIPSWLATLGIALDPADAVTLEDATAQLLATRVAMHRVAQRAQDVVSLPSQRPVAEQLGLRDANELMADLAEVGRSVTWVHDELWARVDPDHPHGRSRGRGRVRRSALEAVTVPPELAPPDDFGEPTAVLRYAAAVAAAGARLDRTALMRAAATMREPDAPWPPSRRDALVDVLAAGHNAIGVIESLDHVGLWERFVPGWAAVRRHAVRSAHVRYTLDRQVLETVAIVARADPFPLQTETLVAACATGFSTDQARQWFDTLGFEPDMRGRIDRLFALQDLLGDTAGRRDIGDPGVLDTVAQEIGSDALLVPLAVLSAAIIRASGPGSWADWKAELVATLVSRVQDRMGGVYSEQYGRVFPTVEQVLLLRAGETAIVGEGRVLTVVAPDRPGLFCRVAGVLVLRGLTVASAEATSSDGMALEEFTVTPAFAAGELAASIAIDWDRVIQDIARAMDGKLAIEARVAERAATYRKRAVSADDAVHVRFDDSVAGTTVLEVDAPDGVGVLYRVTRAFAEVAVDIRQARIETRTDRVVDAFTIVDINGEPIVDPEHRSEIERAVQHALGA